MPAEPEPRHANKHKAGYVPPRLKARQRGRNMRSQADPAVDLGPHVPPGPILSLAPPNMLSNGVPPTGMARFSRSLADLLEPRSLKRSMTLRSPR